MSAHVSLSLNIFASLTSCALLARPCNVLVTDMLQCGFRKESDCACWIASLSHPVACDQHQQWQPNETCEECSLILEKIIDDVEGE